MRRFLSENDCVLVVERGLNGIIKDMAEAQKRNGVQHGEARHERKKRRK